MTSYYRLSLFLVLGLAVAFSGCASKKTKQIRSLQAQVGALTDEVVRLDQSLQETRGQLQSEASQQAEASIRSMRGEGAVSGGVYRTPSGFELPSVDIQKALKNAGYYQGAIDGKIGPNTREAVKAFQRDNGLEADGVIGRKTWEKLKVHLGGTIK